MATLGALALVTLIATACVEEAGGAAGTPTPSPEPRQLTVFAESSLGGAFHEIAGDFQLAHGDVVDVSVKLGASNALAERIVGGEDADVFAAASEGWMDAVERERGLLARQDFVTNQLVVIVSPENPAEIDAFDDLARPGVRLVLGAAGVPVGDYARLALSEAGILPGALANVMSEAPDDAAVVARVAAGSADAGIAYASDVSVAANSDLVAVAIPGDVNVTATYPIGVVAGTDRADLAREFIGWLSTAQGKAVLEDYGFETLT